MNLEIYNLAAEVLEIVQKHCPQKTGNLKRNAVKLYYDANRIVISVDQAIAPYMPYTNEPWISPKWDGKKNPNLYWFDKAFFEVLRYIRQKYRGKLYRTDQPTTEDVTRDLQELSELITYADYSTDDLAENSVALSQIRGRVKDFPKIRLSKTE